MLKLDVRFAGREADAAAEELLAVVSEVTDSGEVEALARLGAFPGFWRLAFDRWPSSKSFETAVRLWAPPFGDRFVPLGTCVYGLTVRTIEAAARVLGWDVEARPWPMAPDWVDRRSG